jgi:hypothetical protein
MSSLCCKVWIGNDGPSRNVHYLKINPHSFNARLGPRSFNAKLGPDLLSVFNCDVERLQSFKHGLLSLGLTDRFWFFFHGCREEDYSRNFLS